MSKALRIGGATLIVAGSLIVAGASKAASDPVTVTMWDWQ
jgi:hypothetical protein